MNLLIIGNGFDLAHNLKTKYTDFLCYCNEYCKQGPICKSDEMNQEFLTFIDSNIWLKYFSKIHHLNQENTWIDFEKEIGKIIDSFEKHGMAIQIEKKDTSRYHCVIKTERNDFLDLFTNVPSTREITKEITKIYTGTNPSSKPECDQQKIKILKNSQITDISLFINFIYQELRNFARAFEIYCLFINDIEFKNYSKNTKNCNMKILNHNTMNRIDHILSFNYTDTYERLYGNDKTKYCYIHGKAQENKSKTNLIFGIDDNLKDGKENEKFEYVKFKKYYQRIVLKTGSEYKDWLKEASEANEKISDVYIVGHSLDKTDYDILYEIFECKNIRVTVYYYNQTDLDEKIQRVIRLLSYKGKNGRDKLIERVHGSDWKIRFVDQYDEKDGIFYKM